MSDATLGPRAPSSLQQFRLLVRLWWLHIRRRPMRVGEAPKVSGVPGFLLISALSTAYMAMIGWQTVVRNVSIDPGRFTWHAFGVMLLGFAIGLSKGMGRLKVGGSRNDAFLDALPLRTFARLGLRLADTITLLPLAIIGPIAAISTLEGFGPSAVLPALLGFVAFVSWFFTGSAVIAWARALGPPSTGRWGGYLGIALSIVSMLGIFAPTVPFDVADERSFTVRFAQAWIGPSPSLVALFGAFALLAAFAYRAAAAAERFGYDQLDPQMRAPKPALRSRDRVALERVMMLRDGGRALLILYGALICLAVWFVAIDPPNQLPARILLFAAGFVVYLGAIQTIGQAGRAARADQNARSFLAALPLSPHEVLDGKTRALRLLLAPVVVLLTLLSGASALHADPSNTYRILLTMVALIVIVEGAVSIAFLSTGIGVIGIGGVQTTGFSTQILMLPLLATLLAPNDWSATTSFIAVVAVTFESRRAARMNVRWIDDPADDVERETTVWRALLAASAFFAVQALSFQILSLFSLSMGYALALSFATSAVLLAVLTWRNDSRIARPRFMPNRAWYWPAGIAAGLASGLLAREFAKLIPAPVDESTPEFAGAELVALGVTMTVIAPLVEEYFFRGWLQRAVEGELPPDKKRWAFVIGAIAFALAHFGTYGVPQLVMGLLAGWLFARGGGLWPCILAHALHNGVVLALTR